MRSGEGLKNGRFDLRMEVWKSGRWDWIPRCHSKRLDSGRFETLSDIFMRRQSWKVR